MHIFEMRAQVTEGDIRVLVESFYARIQTDPILGPIFAARIADDAWPEHLLRMRSFWSTVLLGTGSYRGNPMRVHQQLGEGPGEAVEVGMEHFHHWLALFSEVGHDVLAPAAADAVDRRAERMAESLQIAMGLRR